MSLSCTLSKPGLLLSRLSNSNTSEEKFSWAVPNLVSVRDFDSGKTETIKKVAKKKTSSKKAEGQYNPVVVTIEPL